MQHEMPLNGQQNRLATGNSQLTDSIIYPKECRGDCLFELKRP